MDFEGLGMQKWNKLTDRAQRLDKKKCVHFFSYQVYFQSNGYKGVKSWPFFVFYANDIKK